ncbi:hypothetical protein [Sphingomonas sp. R86520]|uniref:hypothetical protein n=1 Tax=Sphingomonas sp. R86520 TaxID=3093859 RepID=UPI0036D2BF02
MSASLLLGLVAASGSSVEPTLVTAEEAARPDAPPDPRRSLFPGPAIHLLSPTPRDLIRPLTSPVHLKIAFEPTNGASIASSAVAVRLMKQPSVDLTSRLGRSISPAGIDLPIMKLPPGRFPLLISVVDSNGDRRVTIYTLTIAK